MKGMDGGKVLHLLGKTLPKKEIHPRLVSLIGYDVDIVVSFLETEQKLAVVRIEICAIQAVMLSIRFCP